MNLPADPPLAPRRRRTAAILRRSPFATVVLVTIGAFFWTGENWRAARAWAECQHDMTARGERLDLGAACDPVPVERNLARAPLFTHSFDYTVDPINGWVSFRQAIKYRQPQLDYIPSTPEDPHALRMPVDVSSVYKGEWLDLHVWQANYREHASDFGLAPLADGAPLPAPAADVLRALGRFAPVLDDVEQSARMMPEGIFALAPDTPSGGTLVAVRRIVQTLTLRADAHLAAGQPAEARHDVDLILWLRRATTSEPRSFLGAALGCGHLGLALQSIWEGLAARRWTADDLAYFQRRLQSIDALTEYRQAASGQRAEMLFLIDGCMKGRYKDEDIFSPGDSWNSRVPAWLLMHGPGGWLVQNKVNFARFFQTYLMDGVDVPAHRFHPESLDASFAVLTRLATPPVWPSEYLLAVGMPGFLRVGERAALTQTGVDEAIAACALERYALENAGSYPTRLAALTPRYLDRVPTGILDGTPLRYATTPDGRYQLASRILLDTGPSGALIQGNDLVWHYPPGKPF